MTKYETGNPVTPPSIRELLSWEKPYSKFNREERNAAAILYHLLLTGTNLARFCDRMGVNIDPDPSRVEVYFEFAYLRDLWHALWEDNGKNQDKANAARRTLILEFPRPSAAEMLARSPVLDFNQYFGAARASTDYIQSPGRWTVKGLSASLEDDLEFLRTCRFKWAFNIKPDLVVLDEGAKALCVEAKVESPEGSYPTVEADRKEFDRRFPGGGARVGQLELQRHLMQDMLGFDASFVFLVKDLGHGKSKEECQTVSWRNAFGALDYSGCQPYMRAWIESL